jgi:hypothetical protein
MAPLVEKTNMDILKVVLVDGIRFETDNFQVFMSSTFAENEWEKLIDACTNGTAFQVKRHNCEPSISVCNKIVTFTLNSGRGGGMQVTMPAINCIQAFKGALAESSMHYGEVCDFLEEVYESARKSNGTVTSQQRKRFHNALDSVEKWVSESNDEWYEPSALAGNIVMRSGLEFLLEDMRNQSPEVQHSDDFRYEIDTFDENLRSAPERVPEHIFRDYRKAKEGIPEGHFWWPSPNTASSCV